MSGRIGRACLLFYLMKIATSGRRLQPTGAVDFCGVPAWSRVWRLLRALTCLLVSTPACFASPILRDARVWAYSAQRIRDAWGSDLVRDPQCRNYERFQR